MSNLPQISKRTFWDVDISEHDYIHSKEWVITRVFDRGTLDEVFSIINYYGIDFVKNILITTNENLPNHTILLARAIFKLNYSDFKCSERKPFHLHYSIKDYSYNEKYPSELMSSRLMIEGLQLSEMADKKVMPKMLNSETWEDTKRKIEDSIAYFIGKQSG